MKDLVLLIADDELPARKKVLSFLKGIPQKIFAIEAANGIEAVKKIHEARPDLVLLDIQMPGLNGFEVIASVGIDQMPAVVFVTAYDQYALDAFDVNAVDYLLKPFDRARFLKSFYKALEAAGNRSAAKAALSGVMDEISKGKNISERFLVHHGSKYIFIKPGAIIYISSEDKYVRLHTLKGNYLMRDTMNGMEKKLNLEKFARIHRSFIVNVEQVKALQSMTHGDYKVLLANGEKLAVSRRYKDGLLGPAQK